MNTLSTEAMADLVRPSLRHLGVELVDLRWHPGRQSILRLTIDAPAGVSIEDCERVSTAVGAVLDAHDPIAGRYQLEVSSPGAERPVRTDEDWRGALGRRLSIRSRVGEGEEVVEAILMSVDERTIEVETRERNRRRRISLARHDVVAARIVVDI